MDTIRRQGRWKRRGKWLLAAACGAALALFLAVLVATLLVVVGVLRSSEPYRHALRVARSSPAVAMALGEPVRAGWLVSGHFDSDSHGSGDVQLAIPVRGRHGNGVLYVRGERRDGLWHYDVLMMRMKNTGRRIDLLGAPMQLPLPQANCRSASAIPCSTTRA